MLMKFHGPGSTGPADSPSAFSEGPPNIHKLPGKPPGSRQPRTAHARHDKPAEAGENRTAREPELHLGGSWLLLPLTLLAFAVVLPIGIGTFIWIRNRRTEAESRRPADDPRLTARDPFARARMRAAVRNSGPRMKQ